MIYRLEDLVRFAREKSPFYRELYASLPEGPLALEQIPILDQAAYWAANNLQNNRVLTGPMDDGVLYKSGGTTGAPKFSVFTRDEWRVFTAAFGRGMNRCGMHRGERVANLFYSGELYASFLFIHASIEAAPEPAVQLPLSGSMPPKDLFTALRDLRADVLAGVPTSILSLAEFIDSSNLTLPGVRKILFGGESMHVDQRRFLEKVFPGVEIRSIGYASVDAGLLGYADLQCAPNEHRCFSDETIVEIVDETTGEVIKEPGHPGKLLVTSLIRGLMPIIRYPAGDRAEWVEEAGTRDRKFRLLGRSEESARVGPATLYYEDMAQVLAPFSGDVAMQGFQLVLDHLDRKDRVVLRVAVANFEAAQSRSSAVLQRLLQARPMVAQLVNEGKIHAPFIEWVRASELIINRRTGKARRVIDRREARPDSSTVPAV